MVHEERFGTDLNLSRDQRLPKAVKDWSLRSLPVKLITMGGRGVRHARRMAGAWVYSPAVALLRVNYKIGRAGGWVVEPRV